MSTERKPNGSGTAPAADPLDPQAIERLRRLGGSRLLKRMLEIFLEQVPERIRAAQDSLRDQAPLGVERAAHSLKSSCGQMGAPRMAALCIELEHLAAEGELASAADLIEELRREFECYAGWARDELRALSGVA